VTTLRAFRNGDPPALADLWNRGLPDRAVVRPLSAHEFDALVVSRIDFDRDGLIVAQDDASGRLVGFAHAGFGPRQPLGPHHRPDTTMGTVAMLVVDPDRAEPGLGSSLFAAAEAYLRDHGASVIYAGSQWPMDPFYRAIYGNGELSGILDDHRAFVLAATGAGYQPVARTVLMECDLTRAEARDPKAPLLRRQARMEIVDDSRLPGWWDALAIGLFRPSRFDLIEKSLNRSIAHAWTWDIAGGHGLGDGLCRVGLIDLEVDPSFRRKGFGRHLVAEIIRRARDQNTDRVSAQTSAENLPALALYRSLGFAAIGGATLYRRPGGTSEPGLAPDTPAL
jgi:ribosomal protein S18 acetylase RimI-like enzyme